MLLVGRARVGSAPGGDRTARAERPHVGGRRTVFFCFPLSLTPFSFPSFLGLPRHEGREGRQAAVLPGGGRRRRREGQGMSRGKENLAERGGGPCVWLSIGEGGRVGWGPARFGLGCRGWATRVALALSLLRVVEEEDWSSRLGRSWPKTKAAAAADRPTHPLTHPTSSSLTRSVRSSSPRLSHSRSASASPPPRRSSTPSRKRSSTRRRRWSPCP